MSMLSSPTATSVLPDRHSATKKLLATHKGKNNANNHQHVDQSPGKGKKRLAIKPALAQELSNLMLASQPPAVPESADLMLFTSSSVDTDADANRFDDVWNIEDASEQPTAAIDKMAVDSLDDAVEDEHHQEQAVAVAAAPVSSLFPLSAEFLDVLAWDRSLSTGEVVLQSLSWLGLDQDLPILSKEDLESELGPDADEPGNTNFFALAPSR